MTRLQCSVVRKVEYIAVITVHYSENSTVQDRETNTVQCSEVLYTWSVLLCCTKDILLLLERFEELLKTLFYMN